MSENAPKGGNGALRCAINIIDGFNPSQFSLCRLTGAGVALVLSVTVHGIYFIIVWCAGEMAKR